MRLCCNLGNAFQSVESVGKAGRGVSLAASTFLPPPLPGIIRGPIAETFLTTEMSLESPRQFDAFGERRERPFVSVLVYGDAQGGALVAEGSDRGAVVHGGEGGRGGD